MGTRQSGSIDGIGQDEIAVSAAAIATCGRLLAVMRGRIRTYAYPDGGLIYEDRTNRARPRIWRIAADGALLPERSYSFARRAFIRNALPQEALR